MIDITKEHSEDLKIRVIACHSKEIDYDKISIIT